MNMRKVISTSAPARQRGISLIVTLMITVLMSLLALYGAGVLVLDTRSAGNDYRYREAVAAAESGVDQGFGLLSANRARIGAAGLDSNNDGDVADANDSGWTACTSTAAPCLPIRSDDRTNWQYLTISSGLATAPTAGSFTLFLLTPSAGDSSRLVYTIVAIGNSADSDSSSPTTATVKQGVYFYPLLLGNVKTPLAAVSSIPLSGNYTVIANPNGGGTGVPVSAWSRNAIAPGGSFQSCHIGDFVGGTCTSGEELSKSTTVGPDMVANDPNFPTDLFQFLFGVSAANFQTIKDEAQIVSNCQADLTPTSSGLIWVTDANCRPAGDVGSAAAPVLVVAQGDVTINANNEFYGLLFMFNPGSPPTSGDLKSNGTAHLHGAVFAYDDLQLNGTFVLEYDKSVLEALKRNPSSRALARIAGSWSDVLQ
jgi:Tfp pilus assembly protein PilX